MDVHGSSALSRSISRISASPCSTNRSRRAILNQKKYSPEAPLLRDACPNLESAVYHKERFKMRASYKNTSVALLVTLALSLFFVYAMRPNEAAATAVTLETIAEVGP